MLERTSSLESGTDFKFIIWNGSCDELLPASAEMVNGIPTLVETDNSLVPGPPYFEYTEPHLPPATPKVPSTTQSSHK